MNKQINCEPGQFSTLLNKAHTLYLSNIKSRFKIYLLCFNYSLVDDKLLLRVALLPSREV